LLHGAEGVDNPLDIRLPPKPVGEDEWGYPAQNEKAKNLARTPLNRRGWDIKIQEMPAHGVAG